MKKENKEIQENIQETVNVEVEEKTKESTMNETEERLNETKDAYLRLAAEYDNYRKRTAKNITDLSNIAVEKLATDILPVVDDFGRMQEYISKLQDAQNDVEQMKQIIAGFKPISDKLVAALSKHNIKKIEINTGDDFDVDKQEAITAIPAGDNMTNKIVDCTLDGYMHGDKVIRFAKVVVGQ